MIEFKEVKKSFSGREVLKGISFRVEEGEVVFILGTSGTGKSVLLKNLVGLMQPDSGEIWVGPREVSGLSEGEMLEIRKTCGMVFQQPALFDSLSVFENIAFGLRRHGWTDETKITERVEECLQLVHLSPELSPRLPVEISYGMQKRVSLARTLALAPTILLFDEPTTGLDPVTTWSINSLIDELAKKLKTTSLVVSHDMACALAIADRIIFLHQGRILEQGTPQQMLESKEEIIREFLAEVRGES